MRTNTKQIENIRGLTMVCRGRCGWKYIVLGPSRFSDDDAGSIIAVPGDGPNWRNDVYYDTPEQAAHCTRLEWDRLILERVMSRDTNNMWGVVTDDREEFLEALRLLRAGIDLDAPNILKVIKSVLEDQ